MKITERQLRQIINEEVSRLSESWRTPSEFNVARVGPTEFSAIRSSLGPGAIQVIAGDYGRFILRDDVERDELIEFLESLPLPNRREDDRY